MKIDYIVKGELWRSIAVYFLFLFLIITLDHKGYISIDGLTTIILAFFFTVIVFSLLVWYRRKEQLLNPSIFLIINHIFESESYIEKTTEPHENEKISISSSIQKNMLLLIVTMLLYIVYLYASLTYHIDQIFWTLFLLFMGIALSKVIYGERKADQKDPMRLLFFYVIACAFIFVRYLVLDYPILPILKGSMILGLLLVLLVFGIKLSHRKQNSDN
ncbi:hypothetical protein MSLAZ_0870 [Methanosarcina lacustris Z-7289]|uniref:Uncharacterized protein n=1 Tax=Methanosarcina lacustris Z-7289 TaxID=1434111 RepID=A0A0E3S202_9EURY|nr:hypothetical protein [Methanosarcina lacustris]AKB74131.1 hypothetical protein MSLAZ_0870 [Methanosarcina lacustris Z-7289]